MIEQLVIALTGVPAVFLSQSKLLERQRWACVVGLLGQPFWFIVTVRAEQWGMVALCVVYTCAWARGFWNYWVGPVLRADDIAREERLLRAREWSQVVDPSGGPRG